MSGPQSYIVRLLRKVEASLVSGGRQAELSMLEKIVYKISHTENIGEELERLYGVHGFDQLALRLMWSLERGGVESSALESSLIDFEVETLNSLIRSLRNGEKQEKEVQHLSSPKPLDDFYQSLHRFGRVIEELHRKSFENDSFKGVDQDLLYRVLNESTSLQHYATQVDKTDVIRFAEAFSSLVQFVIDQRIFEDVRVVHILENANLTLQTILETAGDEDYDSLQQTIELLRTGRSFLE